MKTKKELKKELKSQGILKIDIKNILDNLNTMKVIISGKEKTGKSEFIKLLGKQETGFYDETRDYITSIKTDSIEDTVDKYKNTKEDILIIHTYKEQSLFLINTQIIKADSNYGINIVEEVKKYRKEPFIKTTTLKPLVELSISTRNPKKWLFIDLECKNIYSSDNNGKFKKATKKQLKTVKKQIEKMLKEG